MPTWARVGLNLFLGKCGCTEQNTSLLEMSQIKKEERKIIC